MKTIIKTCKVFFICACFATLISCSDNQVDKYQHEALKGIDMVEKAMNENNPSQDEIDDLKKEAPKFFEAVDELRRVNKNELSSKQKDRQSEIDNKMFLLLSNSRATPYMHLLMPF